MRQIILELPNGVMRISGIITYKAIGQADNQYSVATFSHDTDDISGVKVDEGGNISFMIRLEKKDND